MPDRCTWPACACRGTGQPCEQRQKEQQDKEFKKASDRQAIRKTNLKNKALRAKDQLTYQRDIAFYMEIWKEREHVCQNCGSRMLMVCTFLFHHILPKRPRGGYPQYRYCKWNVWLLCWRCHDQHDNMNPDSTTIEKLRTEYYRLLKLHEDGTLETLTTADTV